MGLPLETRKWWWQEGVAASQGDGGGPSMPESSEQRESLLLKGLVNCWMFLSTVNVMIKFVFLEGWLWWPWESWTEQ